MRILAVLLSFTLLAGVAVWIPYKDMVIRGPAEPRRVALTFDDGPNPEETEALLEALDRLQVKATFFLMGSHVQAFPELAADIARRGHQIGNHSFSHQADAGFSSAAALEELRRTQRAIEQAAGCIPDTFRPPYGVQGYGLARALRHEHLLPVGANVAVSDWEEQDAAILAQRVIDGVSPGAIVLLHDGHAEAVEPGLQDSRLGTVAAIPLLVKALREQGYEFVAVNTLLRRENLRDGVCP